MNDTRFLGIDVINALFNNVVQFTKWIVSKFKKLAGARSYEKAYKTWLISLKEINY